jgi:hypothetical protein
MLSPDFYGNPVRLHFEDDLPDEIKSHYEKRTKQQPIFSYESIGADHCTNRKGTFILESSDFHK